MIDRQYRDYLKCLWCVLLSALILGCPIAFFWIAAAHGDPSLPHAAFQWFTGRTSDTEPATFDGLFWMSLVGLSLAGAIALGRRRTSRRTR